MDDVSTGADGFNMTAAERIVMNESLKSTARFLAVVIATAPAAMSLSYKQFATTIGYCMVTSELICQVQIRGSTLWVALQ